MGSLFDEIVTASGLAPVIAVTVVERALSRAGVNPTTLTRRTLQRALPELQSALEVYFDAEEVRTRMRRIRTVAGVTGAHRAPLDPTE
jgi:hypothetical protein